MPCTADVAAGKGELAFELLNLSGIPATVLEPRPLDLQKRIKWLLVSVGRSSSLRLGWMSVPAYLIWLSLCNEGNCCFAPPLACLAHLIACIYLIAHGCAPSCRRACTTGTPPLPGTMSSAGLAAVAM
jgi:hypothetical protein